MNMRQVEKQKYFSTQQVTKKPRKAREMYNVCYAVYQMCNFFSDVKINIDYEG